MHPYNYTNYSNRSRLSYQPQDYYLSYEHQPPPPSPHQQSQHFHQQQFQQHYRPTPFPDQTAANRDINFQEQTETTNLFQTQTFVNFQNTGDMHFPPPPPLMLETDSSHYFPPTTSSSSSSYYPMSQQSHYHSQHDHHNQQNYQQHLQQQPQQQQQPQEQSPFLSEADYREHLILRHLEEETKAANDHAPLASPPSTRYVMANPPSSRPYEDVEDDATARSPRRFDYSAYHDSNFASTPPRSYPATAAFVNSTTNHQLDPNVVSPYQHGNALLSNTPTNVPSAASMQYSNKDDDDVDVNDDNDVDETDDAGDGNSPRSCDVLCGQSRSCAAHPGNRKFQQILDDNVDQYERTSSKQQKMQMTKSIVGAIHRAGGRFLKYEKSTGEWTEISNVLARDKVSHALRTKVASRNRMRQRSSSPGGSSENNVENLYDAQQRILQMEARSSSLSGSRHHR